ncbi:hypothetical protein FRB97_003945 [Tulasnella sp. 331]|nr:hypothetical protein FRB97_003945 [Tulasnella sp. 331]
MSWTVIDHDPELRDSDSDSDGLAFDHDAAATAMTERHNHLGTLNPFLRSSPERPDIGEHHTSEPAGKRKRGKSLSSSGDLQSMHNGSESNPPRRKRRKVISQIPVKQRREITEYNHLLSTLRTEATADISSQMLNYLDTQTQTNSMGVRSDGAIEVDISQATIRAPSPPAQRFLGKMDRISRFPLTEEVSRIAQEHMRRQQKCRDADVDLPEPLINALSHRTTALLEHSLDLLYQRRDAVAPSVQIRLRPAGWESLLSAVGATGAVDSGLGTVSETTRSYVRTWRKGFWLRGSIMTTLVLRSLTWPFIPTAFRSLNIVRAKDFTHLSVAEALELAPLATNVEQAQVVVPSSPPGRQSDKSVSRDYDSEGRNRDRHNACGPSDEGEDVCHEDDYFTYLDEDLALLEYSKTAKIPKSTGKPEVKPPISTTTASLPSTADLAKSIIQALQLNPEGDDDDDELNSDADEEMDHGRVDQGEGSQDVGKRGVEGSDGGGGHWDATGRSQPDSDDGSEDESGDSDEDEDEDEADEE